MSQGKRRNMLSRDKLLNGASFLPFQTVEVPELGGAVGVQGLTAGELIAYQKAVDGDDNIVQGIKLIVRCVVDERRERIFKDDEWEMLLSGPHAWPMSALNRVAIAAMQLNQGSAEGNLEATSAGDSSLGSPSRSAKRSRN